MISYFPVVTGSLTVSGSVNISGGITASGGISISGSIDSASYAATASFVALAQSASNAVSAQTASFANTLTVAGNLTAQTLVVQTITSSVDFVTGSTRFGSILGNTHVFSGSVSMNPNGLFVSGSGLVGIGTISPISSLHINEINSITLSKTTNALSSSVGAIEWRNNHASVGAVWAKIDAVTLGTSANPWDYSNITFSTWNGFNSLTERMRITNTGNITIGANGTTNVGGFGSTVVTVQSPNSTYATLELGKATASTSANLGVLSFFNGTNGDVANIIGVSEAANNTGALRFLTSGGSGGTERMRITSGGVIQLGNTSYSPYLTFRTGGGTVYAGVINMDSKNDYLTINGGNSTGYGSGANIGLVGADRYGTTTAGQLELAAGSATNNTSYGYIAFSTANVLRMQISFNGAIGTTAGGTNIYNPSDIRLKRNIIPVSYGLNEILALNPSKFNWKEKFAPSEENKDMLGFIAQEVQTVIPEAVESFGQDVHVNTDGIEYTVENPLRVNEKFIIPVLVKAIQELNTKFEEYKATHP
jgi:hypothetical protein